MNDPDLHAALGQLLRDNPMVHATWITQYTNERTLEILTHPSQTVQRLSLPAGLEQIPTRIIRSAHFRILRVESANLAAENMHQECQDEPIALGTQIQPQGANWLGTAGSPCKWKDSAGKLHWGILSNWHVMADGDQRAGRSQHQPTADRPSIAALSRWHEVTAGGEHTIDAAIADALVDGYHTISDYILKIGPIGDHPIDAFVGLDVLKSGRTTGLTLGTCIAIGAAVRVGYGNFDAILVDQDIFEPGDAPFSGPGDSGSLIVGENCKCPCSLLFAGNDQLTVGNPIRHVNDAFNLLYPFP